MRNDMQRQKFNIRALGVLVIIFSSMHLLLNLCIIALPFILTSGEMQKFMHTLCRMFGPIAIQEDRNIAVLSIKVTASALFLASGIGMVKLKKWSRILLCSILALRIIYAFTVCLILNIFHPHFAIILAVGLFLFYYLSRAGVREQFENST